MGVAAIAVTLALVMPTGAATTINDLAGIQVKDTASGGPLVTDFVHLETTCGAACVLTGGDEVVRNLCPPAGAANAWTWHWSSGAQMVYNGSTCSATNRIAAVHSNGFVSFASGTVCSGAGCYTPKAIPTTTTPNNAIFGAWHDLYPGQNGGNMYAQIQGTSPNRVAIVEWYSVPWACWIDGSETFEIKMFESDNHVDVVYLTQVPGTVDTTFCTGFQGVRVGEENNAGTTGVQYLGGAGIYSAPSNIGLRYADITAPGISATNFACSLAGLNGWCRALTNPLTITDNNDAGAGLIGLGVKSRSFTIDGASPTTYVNGSAQSTTLAEGTHTIVATVTDWAGNAGTATLTTKLDVTLPTLGIQVDCTQNAQGVCTSLPTVTASASDALSGFNTLSCTLDGSPISCTNGQGQQLNLNGGDHSFVATATDMAGNSKTVTKTISMLLDSIPPVVTLAVDCTLGGDAWCVSPASLVASATDETQLSSLTCTLDGQSLACSNGVAQLLSTAGAHTFAATATDSANNVATASRAFKIDLTAPTISLSSACDLAGSAGWCRGTQALSASATDATSGLGSLSCTLDGAASDCATSVLSQGAHTFAVTATDVAGNVATTSASFKIDGILPDVAAALACASPGNAPWCLGGVTSGASASDAGSGVGSLVCALDGATVACDGTPSLADGSHSLVATATDAAGNVASTSAALSLDTTAPALTIGGVCDTPGNAGWCRGSFAMDASATDATSGLLDVRCTLDGSSAPCSATNTGNGGHQFAITATDAAGNVATQTFGFQIDSVAPPVDAALGCASPGNAPWCLGGVSSAASASDAGSGLASLACAIDGVAADCDGAPTLADGAHGLVATATDAAGNVATATASLQLDTTPPGIDLVSACDVTGNAGWCRGVQSLGVSTFDFTSGAGSVQCALDAVIVDCSTSEAGQGAHSFAVTALDAAGNEATTSAAFKIDSVAPAVDAAFGCASPGNAPWCLGGASTSATASDAGSGLADLQCTLDSGAAACDDAPTLLDGAHAFAALATDVAGNTASASSALSLDGTAPTIDLASSCATPGALGWCIAGLAASGAGVDATSGLGSLACQLDGVDVACDAIAIAGDGTHVVTAHAVDVAGNAADTTITTRLDGTAPTLSLAPTCALPGANGWCRASVSLTTDASDATSGLASLACSIDDVATDCGALAVTSDGAHRVVATATDAAGNVATQTVALQLDATPPVVGIAPTCSLAGNAGWCRAATFAYATSSADATSGPASVLCTLDGAAAACDGSGSGEGAHALAVTATDLAGNSASASNAISIDSIAPTLTLTHACDLAGDGGWCRGALSGAASASDATSGVDTVACSVDGATADCGALGATADGAHTFSATVTDVAGNAADASAALQRDGTAPTVTMELLCSLPGTTGYCRAASFDYTGASSDATSGLASVVCTLDGTTADCAGSATGDAIHAVALTARDAAGNVATIERSLRIDSAGLVLSLAKDCSHAGNGVWCLASSVGYAIEAQAPSSAIDTIACTVDGAVAPCSGTTSGEGMHEIAVTATSVAGASASDALGFGIDSVAPSAAIALDCATPGATNWCLASTVGYSVSTTDATSGVAAVSCMVDDVEAACAGDLIGEGGHQVLLSVWDAAGHSSSTVTTISIDSIVPTISVAPSGTHGLEGWFRSAVSVSLGCADATSGVSTLAYTLDGSASATYVAPILVTKQGVSPLAVTCADAAGNVAHDLSDVKIDSVSPTGSVTAPLVADGSFDVMWTAADVTSGLSIVHVQQLVDAGVLGTTYEDVCVQSTSGAQADGACHVVQAPSFACYRIVVLDIAGNVAVGSLLDPTDVSGTIHTVTTACTVSSGTAAGVASHVPQPPASLVARREA